MRVSPLHTSGSTSPSSFPPGCAILPLTLLDSARTVSAASLPIPKATSTSTSTYFFNFFNLPLLMVSRVLRFVWVVMEWWMTTKVISSISFLLSLPFSVMNFLTSLYMYASHFLDLSRPFRLSTQPSFPTTLLPTLRHSQVDRLFQIFPSCYAYFRFTFFSYPSSSSSSCIISTSYSTWMAGFERHAQRVVVVVVNGGGPWLSPWLRKNAITTSFFFRRFFSSTSRWNRCLLPPIGFMITFFWRLLAAVSYLVIISLPNPIGPFLHRKLASFIGMDPIIPFDDHHSSTLRRLSNSQSSKSIAMSYLLRSSTTRCTSHDSATTSTTPPFPDHVDHFQKHLPTNCVVQHLLPAINRVQEQVSAVQHLLPAIDRVQEQVPTEEQVIDVPDGSYVNPKSGRRRSGVLPPTQRTGPRNMRNVARAPGKRGRNRPGASSSWIYVKKED